jgi:hypothetical protein
VRRGTDDNLASVGASWATATAAQRNNRKTYGYYGRGKYGAGAFMRGARKAARGRIGRTVGGMLRDEALSVADGYTGGAASAAYGAYSGRGMYTGSGMYSNHLVSGGGGSSGSPPRFASEMDEEGALVITHREFVRDVYGNPALVNFQNSRLDINPGLSSTFPWLSQLAANYEEYEMNQLMFVYESKISENATSTDGQLGSVIMFTDYGADSKIKTSKQQMLQGYGAQDGLCTRDAVHGVECDPSKIHGDGHKYVRVRPLEASSSLNDYDLGIFQLAVSGTPNLNGEQLANQIIGQLYVQYTCKLRKPRLYSKLGFNIQKDVFTSIPDATALAANPTNLQEIIYPGFVQSGDFNSIGTLLTLSYDAARADRQDVLITFPAYYAGSIEIHLYVETDEDVSGTTNWASLLDFDSNGPLPGGIILQGNVQYINDIYPMGPDDQVGPGPVISFAGLRGGMLTLHVAVEQADTGVDNTVRIQLDDRHNVGPSHPVVSSQIVVQAYNNYEVNGMPPGLPSV